MLERQNLGLIDGRDDLDLRREHMANKRLDLFVQSVQLALCPLFHSFRLCVARLPDVAEQVGHPSSV